MIGATRSASGRLTHYLAPQPLTVEFFPTPPRAAHRLHTHRSVLRRRKFVKNTLLLIITLCCQAGFSSRLNPNAAIFAAGLGDITLGILTLSKKEVILLLA